MDACSQALFRNSRISNVSQVRVESPLLPVSEHKRLLLIPIAIEKSLSTAAFTTATRYCVVYYLKMKVTVVFALVSFFLGCTLQAVMSEDGILDKAEEELVREMVSTDQNLEEGLDEMDDNNVGDDEDGHYEGEQDDDDQPDNDRLEKIFLLENME